MNSNGEQIAVVLGGGGERVVAWEVGVLAGLADAGIDLRDADAIIGTSAGSLVAARLAAGEDPRVRADEIAARTPALVPVPDVAPFELVAQVFSGVGTLSEGRRRIGAVALGAETQLDEDGSIAAATRRVPADDWPAPLGAVTVDAERGTRFVVDASAGVAPGVGVAASRAVPGMLPPITVAGRRLIDGAIGSATNADAVIDAAPAHVFVIAALPLDDQHRRLGMLWDEALRAELDELRTNGVGVTLIQANVSEMAAMGPDPLNAGRAPLAVRAGRRRGRQVGRTLSAVGRVLAA